MKPAATGDFTPSSRRVPSGLLNVVRLRLVGLPSARHESHENSRVSRRFQTDWRSNGLAPLLSVLLGAAAGCGCYGAVCGSCPPALVLRVTDQKTGAPVTDVAVAGPQADCEPLPEYGYTECRVALGTGDYELGLSAPGYADLQLRGTIEADSGDDCCSCGYNQKRRDVAMTPQ